ncbi:PP2C family protein-serine/threonine phosphatase [Tunturiibacter gelidiferens]|uniref:PP2C family protein-serine/threonine phosphatase n=1 Tax=Tunturiibacter gelidiferens TaxID=3069689 RepID=UPI003D9B1A9B
MLWPDLLRSNGGTVTIAPQIDVGLQAQLELARQVQLRLLPDRRCCLSDWEVAFSYESAGFVSGDYVDLIPAGADAFYFALGDVSGKGVAASMLMSHLHATLRTLLPSNRTIEEVVTIASSTFCQSALPAQFATLVLGKADRSGNVELVNAGHNPVLLVEGAEVEVIGAASLPLGMFCSTEFASVRRRVSPESTLFLYSDGITESTNESGNEFDQNRLSKTLLQSRNLPPTAVVETIQRTIGRYTNGAQPSDDRTMLALRWSPKGI